MGMLSVLSFPGRLALSVALGCSLASFPALAHHNHHSADHDHDHDGDRDNDNGNSFQNWVNANHPANNETPEAIPEGIGFTCTEAGGNTLACTNLPPSCAQWWPRCALQDFAGGAKMPSNCATPTFKLVSMAGAAGEGLGLADLGGGAAAAPNFAASFANKNSAPAPATPPGGPALPTAAPASSPASASAPAASTTAASAPLPANVPAYAAAFLNMAPAGATPVQPPAAAPAGPAPTSAGHYDDPWIDYSASTHTRDALVETLANTPALRQELRQKIAAQAAADPSRNEQLEYYRRALADAEKRSSARTVFKSLTPLETFSLNSEETDHEVRRLISSMNGDEESARVPLFPRVHEALQRALAQGNVHVPIKR